MSRIPNIVHMEYGSRLYGTATPTSDTDYAGIYMPTMEDLLLQKVGKGNSKSTGKEHEKNTKDDVDEILYPLPRFIQLCLAGDTTALDMLHCDVPINSHPIWDELVSKRKMFYCKNMKAYVGYVKSQAVKYGMKGDRVSELRKTIDRLEFITHQGRHGDHKIKDWEDGLFTGEYIKWFTADDGVKYYEVLGKKYWESNTIDYVKEQLTKVYEGYGHRAKLAAENKGMDWKAIHHSLRVMYQVRAIIEYGDFYYPLAETDFLMRVKRGDVDYETEVAPEFDKFFDSLQEMIEKSGLPEKPDVKYWEKWLLGVYDSWFNITYLED